MGLPPGRTNNPMGRPKGSTNRIGNKIRQMILELIENNFNSIENDLKELPKKERIRFFLALLPYTVPKYRTIQIEVNDRSKSDEEIREMVQNLFPEELNGDLPKEIK